MRYRRYRVRPILWLYQITIYDIVGGMGKEVSKPDKEPKGRGNEKPVSLAPLSFDEALDGLLAVKPEPKGEAKESKKLTAKKPAKK